MVQVSNGISSQHGQMQLEQLQVRCVNCPALTACMASTRGPRIVATQALLLISTSTVLGNPDNPAPSAERISHSHHPHP
jgi:hypothetical protein